MDTLLALLLPDLHDVVGQDRPRNHVIGAAVGHFCDVHKNIRAVGLLDEAEAPVRHELLQCPGVRHGGFEQEVVHHTAAK